MSLNLEKSVVDTRLEKVNFHFSPKEGQCQRNVQTTIQLCSFHMLVRLCSKFFKLGFISTWTENFKCTSWILKRQRSQRSNCQHCWTVEFQKNIYFCFIDYAKSFECMDHNKLWEILKEIRVPICSLRNLYVGKEATVRIERKTTDWLKIGKAITSL